MALTRRTLLQVTASGALLTGCTAAGEASRAGAHPAVPAATTETAAPAEASATPATGAVIAALPPQVEHGPRDRPQVALTFHGQGSPAEAEAVLAAAEKGGAKVTVLAVGSWLDAFPAVAERVLGGGHELGNHTQTHGDIGAMGEVEASAEITRCAARLKQLTASQGRWFRPSQARLTTPLVLSLAQRAGYPHLLSYDVDPLDYTDPGPAAVRAAVAVVPSWDLRTLWVNNDVGNSLTPIDPATGKVGRPVAVHDPYNLYFTPNGRYAIVMASLDRQLVFRDAHTMAVVKTVPVSCYGVNHADFSPDGRYFIVSCEFSGELLKVDTAAMKVVAQQKIPYPGSMPQDVKIAPDGRTWYIADMAADGVWTMDGDTFSTPKLLPTGKGAHGLYVSRDSRHLYVSNRGEGSVSLLDFATGKLTAKWHIDGGGSPDMGGVSADGKVLWLTGRYNAEVYALDTATGRTLAKIPVGAGPHGLAVYPQPGRYSLGHTGIFR